MHAIELPCIFTTLLPKRVKRLLTLYFHADGHAALMDVCTWLWSQDRVYIMQCSKVHQYSRSSLSGPAMHCRYHACFSVITVNIAGWNCHVPRYVESYNVLSWSVDICYCIIPATCGLGCAHAKLVVGGVACANSQ